MIPHQVQAVTLIALLSTGCGGVVDRRAFAPDGKLEWSTVMPGSRNAALWLSYALNGPLTRKDPEEPGTLAYQFYGQLDVKGGGRAWYGGGMFLQPTGPALDRTYAVVLHEDVQRECTYSTCTERGRMKLLSLQEVPAGTLLEIKASLPTSADGVDLLSAELQLAPN